MFRGRSLETVGDATDLFAQLPHEQINRHHWHRAVMTMQVAIKCRQYLTTATINLQTAAALEAAIGR